MNNETASSNVLTSKKAHKVEQAIKHHVRAIQRRLKRIAKINKKQDTKLEAIEEPVTFCERVHVEKHFSKRLDKQKRKIVRHVVHASKLGAKIEAAGIAVRQVQPEDLTSILPDATLPVLESTAESASQAKSST